MSSCSLTKPMLNSWKKNSSRIHWEIVKRFPNVILPEPSLRLMVWPAAASVTALLSRSCLKLINRVRHPFSVNDLSQLAAIAALEDQGVLGNNAEKQ